MKVWRLFYGRNNIYVQASLLRSWNVHESILEWARPYGNISFNCKFPDFFSMKKNVCPNLAECEWVSQQLFVDIVPIFPDAFHMICHIY